MLPWTEIFVNETSAKPCCIYNPKTKINFKDYASNKEIEEVKNQFLNNEIPSQCSTCYKNELNSGYSARIASNFNSEEFKEKIISGKWENNHYKNIHILTSNICNLKCLPCEYASYSRDLELKNINLINREPKKYVVDDEYKTLLNFNFDSITLIGGEPFYDKKTIEIIDFLIDNNKSKNTTLYINSNFTNLNDEILKKLNDNFFKVILKASIDGIGKRNEYLRYPSQWDTIQSNIRKTKNYPNLELLVTVALSNLSLIGFCEIVEWILKENIHYMFTSMVNSPKVLQTNILPVEIKKSLIPKLKELLEMDYGEEYKKWNREQSIRDCICSCIKICEDETDYSEQWEKTKEWINAHDNYRGNSILEVFPELRKFW